MRHDRRTRLRTTWNDQLCRTCAAAGVALLAVLLGLTARVDGDVLPPKRAVFEPSAPLLKKAKHARSARARHATRRMLDVPYDDEKPIKALSINILPTQGQLPPDYAAARFEREGAACHHVGTSRPWMHAVYDWEASAFCHQPLHFEEPNVERLGHSAGLLQPVVSGAHFFARIPALPYMIGADPPYRCRYTLGHYRPGNCAPLQYIRLPVSVAGAVAQVGTVLGLVYLIP